MRKLAALLFAVMLLAPALSLAQDQTATPTAPEMTAQPAQVQINPADLPAAATLDRAIAGINADKFEQAALDSSVFILLNPTFAHGYLVRAAAYQGLGRLQEAIDDLTRSLPMAQNDAVEQFRIYLTRARLYVGTSQFPKALDDITNAIKINPTSDAYVLRSQILMQQLDFPNAIKDLTLAIQLSPDTPALLLVRATAYDAMGNNGAAAEDYLGWISAQKPQQLSGQPTDLGVSFTLNMAADKLYVAPIIVKKGQSVSISATKQSGTVDPLIVLLDPKNNPLIASDNISATNSNALIDKFVIPADGTYPLLIFYAGGGSDGQVAVQIRGQ